MTRFTIRLDSPGVALALKKEKSTHSFDLLIPRWHLHSSDWASSKIYRVWEWYIFKDLPLLRCDWVWPASRVRRFRGQITVSRARRVTLRASAHWKWQIACLPNSMKISTFPTHIQPTTRAHTFLHSWAIRIKLYVYDKSNVLNWKLLLLPVGCIYTLKTKPFWYSNLTHPSSSIEAIHNRRTSSYPCRSSSSSHVKVTQKLKWKIFVALFSPSAEQFCPSPYSFLLPAPCVHLKN